MQMTETAERWASLALASLVILMLEVGVLQATLGEGKVTMLGVGAAVTSLLVALPINAAPQGRKGRAAALSALTGLILTLLAMALVPVGMRTAASAQAMVVCLVAAGWLIPHLAAQHLLARGLIRLRDRLLA